MVIPPPWDPGARYARSEEYKLRNAAITARGAAALLEERLDLPESSILVLGFGRVGKLCALELARQGSSVTVCARSGEQRLWAQALGFSALPPEQLVDVLPGYEAVINTVPAPVLTPERMERCHRSALLLELASDPGGIDAEYARAHSLRYIRAAGLPGKYAPRQAAEVLRDAVYAAAEAQKPRLGVALTGSHCSFEKVFAVLPGLRRSYELIPILSESAGSTDTRFGAARDIAARLEALCGHGTVRSIPEAEPLGTSQALDALLVAPCTGNTLSKLAHGVTDTPVTMACKAHLRNGRPLILAVSTNDGLSGSAENLGRLLQRKNVYFVPFGQDDPAKKPFSLQADFARTEEAVEAARVGRQLQPILR